MEPDALHLRPTELIRLVNSTSLGPVADYAIINRHMNSAGLRIGDGRRINLVRYVRWLIMQEPEMPKAASSAKSAGQARRERLARKSRQDTASVADIGELPEVERPELLDRCRNDLHLFLVEVFPASTGLKPFGADQVKAIKFIEQCILHGGRFAQAFPRGFAKTTISIRAALWGVLYGHRRYIPVFGGNADAAENIIASFKTELSENPILGGMFPGACYPIRCLEGKPQRCASQTYQGELTHVKWTADRVVLPTIPGSQCSGSVLQAKSMVAARGLQYTTPDGEVLRPDFVILDDPQTDDVANSPSETRKVVATIKKSILRGGGHSRTLAAVMNATVIQPDDVAETFLTDSGWQSCRYKMIKAWPATHADLWLEKYASIRRNYNADDPESQRRAHRAALEFYLAHRKQMDAGADVAWEWAYAWDDDDSLEVSALQHAYNILIDDGEDVFASECQNEPLTDKQDEEVLKVEDVLAKYNGRKRGMVPSSCNKLTMFVDVHDKLLFCVICAWGEGFTGCVIDYGTFPKQKRRDFTLRNAPATLGRRYQGVAVEVAIFKGLDELVSEQLGREFVRDDGAVMHIDRCLIDKGYAGPIVEDVCRRLGSSVVMPSRGVGITASNKPFEEYRHQPGQQIGHYWRIPSVRGTREMRYVMIDTNYWKTFSHARLKAGMGSGGCLSIFGNKRVSHRLFAEHVTSEYWVRTEGRGRTVDVWKDPPGSADNHWFDGLVGCCAAASMEGIALAGEAVKVRTRRLKPVNIKERKRLRLGSRKERA